MAKHTMRLTAFEWDQQAKFGGVVQGTVKGNYYYKELDIFRAFSVFSSVFCVIMLETQHSGGAPKGLYGMADLR